MIKASYRHCLQQLLCNHAGCTPFHVDDVDNCTPSTQQNIVGKAMLFLFLLKSFLWLCFAIVQLVIFHLVLCSSGVYKVDWLLVCFWRKLIRKSLGWAKQITGSWGHWAQLHIAMASCTACKTACQFAGACPFLPTPVLEAHSRPYWDAWIEWSHR